MSNFSTCVLGDKFERVTRKNTAGNTNVLTISAQHGLINQFEYYNNQYASEDTSGYTLLRKGEFAYNKSYSEGYPLGATKKLERYESGIVSPLYICFAAKAGVCVDFYSHYFESEPFYREIYKIAQEGARNHGLLNVPAEDFFQIKIADPPLAEQKRIAEILGCCDRGIALKKELIAEKKRQKKALMQKLLDPDSGFRLPGFAGKWTLKTIGSLASRKGDYGINAPACSYLPNLPRYIRITDIDDNCKFIKDNNAYVDISDYEDYVLKESDIVFVRTGGTVGKSYVYNPEDGKLVFAGFLIRFRFEEPTADYRFIKQIISTDKYFQWVSIMSARSGQPGINAEEYASYEFFAPDLKEQQAIADVLSAADKEIDLLEQELAQQQQKKKSLMQLLLTGIARV